MGKREELRSNADRCLRLAQNSRDISVKSGFLALAARFQRLAHALDKLDQLHEPGRGADRHAVSEATGD